MKLLSLALVAALAVPAAACPGMDHHETAPKTAEKKAPEAPKPVEKAPVASDKTAEKAPPAKTETKTEKTEAPKSTTAKKADTKPTEKKPG